MGDRRIKDIGYWILIIPILLGVTELFAQFPSGNRIPGNSQGGAPGNTFPQQEEDPALDTLSKEVYFYYADNAAEKFQFQDSSFTNFHLYDPIRQAEYEHLHLGNLGSAHRQIVFQPRFHQGFDAGYHNYDLYLTRPEDIRYYELEKAYSDIYFSQSNQEKTSFTARFSKPIGQNMNLAIDYKNIRNQGQYTHQAARTNAFTANANYEATNQKYRAYLSFTTNTVEQLENGGGVVSDITNFRKGILPPGRPVNTSTGDARYFQRDLNFSHYYLLQKTPKEKELDSLTLKAIAVPPTNKADSVSNERGKGRQRPTIPPATTASSIPLLPETGRKFTLKHNLILRKNTYKYVDESNLGYYGNFVLDDRGVRNFIESNQIENTFSIRTFRLDKGTKISLSGATIADKNTTQKDLIELGITHKLSTLFQEPQDSTINNVFLFGKVQFTPSERLKIKTYGHLGMLKQIGDYYIKGDFLWDTKKLGKIKLSLVNQLYSPSLLQQKFLVTQQTIWQNAFKKVFETSLSASYALPKLKIDLTANYHLIDNFIYYNQEAKPQQLNRGLNIVQLIVKNQIDVSRFHLQNTIYFQKGTVDVLRFPEIYSIHRLYMDLKLFKVMESQLGTDVRLNTSYRPDNFQPLTAQFFLQDTYETQFHPTIDIFFNFRIQQFRFFFIYENIYDYFTPKFNYFTYPYPQFDAQARFGFRWLFLD